MRLTAHVDTFAEDRLPAPERMPELLFSLPALRYPQRLNAAAHLLDRHVRSLSRGENQRVVIARALLSAPQLLLLDEPLTSLDAKLKNAILQQLQTLHREFGVPMLFVTHDPMEATAICEEVILLQAGRIIGRGDPAKLLG